MTTFEPILAREVRDLCRAHQSPKNALRRIAWYARRRGVPAPAPRDLMHVFCEDMSHAQTVAMRRFLLKRRQSLTEGLLHSDLCLLSAQAMLGALTAPLTAAQKAEARAEFAADAQALLALIAKGSAPAYVKHAAPAHRYTLDKAVAARALSDVAQSLREHGIRPFILSGTLLGAVREGDFLPHDYDIDLGVFADDADLDRLQTLFADHPQFTVLKQQSQTRFETSPSGALTVTSTPVVLKIAHTNGIPIDIFLHYQEGNIIWHGTDLYRWDNTAFDLVPYSLRDVRIEGPRDADLFLTENYGDWRVPKTNFQCALDTPNQSIVPNPMSLALFLRRAWLELERDPRSSAALIEQLLATGFIEGNAEQGYRLADETFTDQTTPVTA